MPKHAGSDVKGSNPTKGRTLLWARNPFRGNFNHWQVSQKEAVQTKYMRRTVGYIWTDYKTNTQIAKELK
jgi:hypothetical protein